MRDETSRRGSPSGGARGTSPHPLVLAATGMSLVAVCYGLARFAYGLFVPSFRDEFDLDGATIGAIASLSYVAYCLGIVAATVLSPRMGARLVAGLAGTLATLGTAAIAAAPDATFLAIGVALAGSSTGVASPPLAQAVASTVPQGQRDRIQTLVNAGTGLGVLVSGPVSLIAAGHWRLAWGAFAILCALATIAVVLAVPAAREASASRGLQGRLPAGALQVILAATLTGVATAAVWTFGQDVLRTVGGQDASQATVAWIALGACGLAGAAAGDLITRVGIAWSWWASLFVSALATTIIGLWADNAVLTSTASGLFGGAYIALTGILLVWSTRVFSNRPSIGVGVTFLALAVGQALGAPILGVVADRWNLQGAFVLASLITALGAFMVPRKN